MLVIRFVCIATRRFTPQKKGKPKDPRMQALQKALDSSGDRDLKWLDITATRSYGLVPLAMAMAMATAIVTA